MMEFGARFGAGLYGVVQILPRFVKPTKRPINIAEAGMGLGQRRLEIERSAIGGDRLVGSIECRECIAEIVMRIGKVRLEVDRFVIVRYRFGVTIQSRERTAKIIAGLPA